MRNKFKKLAIFVLLFVAKGLYKLNEIAFPIPNSAIARKLKTFVNKPFKPK